MKSLSTVTDFGSIEAKNDKYLAEGFREHPSYLEIKDMEAFLVVGRKGSGKTAIYRRLEYEASLDKTITVVGHTFDDYPWDHHEKQGQSGVPAERRFIHSWKYLILLKTAFQLVNEIDPSSLEDDRYEAFQNLAKFVEDSYGRIDPDFTSVFKPKTRLRIGALLKVAVMSVKADFIDVKDLPKHFQEVNRAMLRNVLCLLDGGRKYFVCFDEIDLGFDSGQEDHANRLNGLILAARDIFVEARAAEKVLNPVVFIRSDIFKSLSFEDKNKISSELATHVSWSENDSFNLQQLMEARFAVALDEAAAENAPRLVSWDLIFDTTKKFGQQSQYAHMIDRTMLRPRDMIKFCNLVLKVFKKDPASPTLFTNEHIVAARGDYSRYLLGEIQDELRRNVSYSEAIFKAIRAIGSETFGEDTFCSQYVSSGGDPTDVDSALKTMFDFSIIGVLKSGGQGGGAKYEWKYKDEEAIFEGSKRQLRVHPGLKEALQLTRQYQSTDRS